MGTRRAADHEKRTSVEHNVEELQPKLDIARDHAEERLATFDDEMPQLFITRFIDSRKKDDDGKSST